ncbi:hypothetical protein PVAND_009704 [Polypedilum vanderplanki]|uniref:Uncharacterized protein n=1 Tax=Polypedilum vanderplanki TaxID=319348 RepID=A0A9J6CEH2_POLVA|nr:hypothetical protein PVAND_009704 [Polypedilum vanderplanki]
MKLLLLAIALFGTSSSQMVEPLIGLLAPAPQNLLTIRGPVYVEPSALQPPSFMLGPPVSVGPPILGPPIVTSPITSPMIADPLESLFSFDTPLINRLGTPVISPNPFNPYQTQVQIVYDEDQKAEKQAQLQNEQTQIKLESLQHNPNSRLYENQLNLNARIIPQNNLNQRLYDTNAQNNLYNQRLLHDLLNNNNNLNQRISENQVYQNQRLIDQQNLNTRYMEALNNQHNQRLNEIRMISQNLQNQRFVEPQSNALNSRLVTVNQNNLAMPDKRWIWYYNQRRTFFDEPDDEIEVEQDTYVSNDENDEDALQRYNQRFLNRNQFEENEELTQRSQLQGAGISQNQMNQHQNIGLQMQRVSPIQRGYFQGQRRLFDESTLFDDETSDDSTFTYRRRK